MNDAREFFATATVGQAAMVAKHEEYAPGDPKMDSAKEDLSRLIRQYRASATAAAVQTTLIARRLQAFRETGVLPPEVQDDGSLARAIDSDAPAMPEARKLPLDLVALAKELGLPPPPRAALPAAPPLIARRAESVKPAPAFMRDAGRGRAQVDPVPALIDQLSSEEPRLRAFAADELAGQGAAAVVAVAALRHALSDSDARVRSSSATALGSIVPPDSEVVDDLRRALVDKDVDVRFSARAALRRLGVF